MQYVDNWENPMIDPTAPTHADFDWDGLAIAMGEAGQDLDAPDIPRLAIALRSVLGYILDTDLTRKGADRRIARRCIALAWVVNPAIFEGASLTALARQMKIYPERLHEISGGVSEVFGITNPGQKHAWNRGRKGKGPRGDKHPSGGAQAAQDEPVVGEWAFICPKCTGHHFTRLEDDNGKILTTVKCECGWVGEWVCK